MHWGGHFGDVNYFYSGGLQATHTPSFPWQPKASSTANWRGAETARRWTSGRPGVGQRRGREGPLLCSHLLCVCLLSHRLAPPLASQKQNLNSEVQPGAGDAAVWCPSTAQPLCAPVNSFRKQTAGPTSATMRSLNASPRYKRTPGGAGVLPGPGKLPGSGPTASRSICFPRPPRQLLPRSSSHTDAPLLAGVYLS